MSITRIESINSNSSYASALLDALRESFISLEYSLRGRPNTTIINDRKNKVHPVSEEEHKTVIPAAQRFKLLKDARNLPQVTAGTIRINDTVVSVNPQTESYDDIVNKINASTAKVIAGYDPETNRFSIRSKDEGSQLIIESDSSNLLYELNINPGTYIESTDSPVFSPSFGARNKANVVTQTNNFINAANEFLTSNDVSDESKTWLKNDLFATLSKNNSSSSASDASSLPWGFYVNFYVDNPEPISLNTNALYTQLFNDSHPFVRFFSGNMTDNGLISRAESSLANFTIEQEVISQDETDMEDITDLDALLKTIIENNQESHESPSENLTPFFLHHYGNNIPQQKQDLFSQGWTEQILTGIGGDIHDNINTTTTVTDNSLDVTI